MNREPSGDIESTLDCPDDVRFRRITPEATSYTKMYVVAFVGVITPTMNFGVLLLACAFLGVVFLLRGDVALQSPSPHSAIGRSTRATGVARPGPRPR